MCTVSLKVDDNVLQCMSMEKARNMSLDKDMSPEELYDVVVKEVEAIYGE